MAMRQDWTAAGVVIHVKVCFLTFTDFYMDFDIVINFMSEEHVIQIDFLAVPVIVKLQAIEETSGISWRITNTECKSDTNLQLSANRVYNEDCELSLGQSYTLECDGEGNTGSPNYNGWWKANFLTIENSVYCEYSDGKEIMNITITGKAYGLETNFLLYMLISLR